MIIRCTIADGWRIKSRQPGFYSRVGAGHTIHFPAGPHVQLGNARCVGEPYHGPSFAVGLVAETIGRNSSKAGLPILLVFQRHHAGVDHAKRVVAEAQLIVTLKLDAHIHGIGGGQISFRLCYQLVVGGGACPAGDRLQNGPGDGVVAGCGGVWLRAEIAGHGIKGNLSVLEEGIPLGSELQDVGGFHGLYARRQQSQSLSKRLAIRGKEEPIGQRVPLVWRSKGEHRAGHADPLRSGKGRLQIQAAFGVADEIDLGHPEVGQDPGKDRFKHGRIGLDGGAVVAVVGAQAHESRAESGFVGVVVHVVTRSGAGTVGSANSGRRRTVVGFQPVRITARQAVHEHQHRCRALCGRGARSWGG